MTKKKSKKKQENEKREINPQILNTWSGVYSKQIIEGEDYSELAPVISIWLLGSNLFHKSSRYHHHFRAWDELPTNNF